MNIKQSIKRFVSVLKNNIINKQYKIIPRERNFIAA